MAAAADRSGSTVEESERLSGGGNFIQNEQHIDHLLVGLDAPYFLALRSTAAFLPKPVQSILESSVVRPMARQWKPLLK